MYEFIHTNRTSKASGSVNEEDPEYVNRPKTWSGELYNVRAMQLWRDWNKQVYDFGMAQGRNFEGTRPSKVGSDSSSSTFEYLMLRSEDLVDPERKWQVYQVLADFVGSSPMVPLTLPFVSSIQNNNFSHG